MNLMLIAILLFGCKINSNTNLIEIGEKIETTINSRETEFLNSLLSYDLFLADAFKFFGTSIEDRNDLIKTYKDKFRIGDIILNMTKQTGGITFLKQSNDILVFNVYSEDVMNYVEFEFVKHEANFRIKDIYVYSWGCTIGDQMIESTKIVSREIGEGKRDHQTQIILLRDLINSNQIEKARMEFSKFSKEYKELKMIKAIEISIATRDTMNEATEFITEYITQNPTNRKFISYLNFTKAFYEDNCEELKVTSKLLSKFTGNDEVLNEYVRNCKN